MSDDEVDELLKAVDTSSGEINYTGILIPPRCLTQCQLTRSTHRSRADNSGQLTTLFRPLSYSFHIAYMRSPAFTRRGKGKAEAVS